MIGVAAAVSGQAVAQSDPAPPSGVADRTDAEDQIAVRGKALSRYRLEFEEARDELIDIYNEETAATTTTLLAKSAYSSANRTRIGKARARQSQALPAPPSNTSTRKTRTTTHAEKPRAAAPS